MFLRKVGSGNSHAAEAEAQYLTHVITSRRLNGNEDVHP
jgi:hypothetical protein